MKVNLMIFSLFLLVSIMACNVFAFSISGGRSETSYKETEKTSVMTTTHSTKLQPSQAILGNDSNLLIVFYVQIMPDDFVMQLHR
ncbi:hypothetical protein OU595_15480, partial [Escherichia coli]|nr:hypothetical protein [Escherichia coli]